MADERYHWSQYTTGRLSESDAAYESRVVRQLELNGRPRTLAKDSDLTCFVKNCKKQCKEGEYCTRPRNANTQNQIIAHVDCVDQFCSELKAAGRKAEIKVLDAKGILHPPAVAKSQKLSKSANSKTSASKTSANSDPLYYQGWYSGVHFKFEGKMAETPQTNDPEWFRGFLDGAEFASEHGAQK